MNIDEHLYFVERIGNNLTGTLILLNIITRNSVFKSIQDDLKLPVCMGDQVC